MSIYKVTALIHESNQYFYVLLCKITAFDHKRNGLSGNGVAETYIYTGTIPARNDKTNP